MKSSERMFSVSEIVATFGNILIDNKVLMGTIDYARQGMIPAPDAIGFDEYFNAPDSWRDHDLLTWNTAQAALLADPMVIDLRGVEWPEWADGIRVMFCNKRAMEFKDQYGGPDGGRYENMRKIPRPIPVWQPKDWEPVFVLNGLDQVIVGLAKEIGDKITVKWLDGTACEVPLNRLKPFDASKIGMKWSEIE